MQIRRITGIGELITNDGDDGTYAILNNAALVISGDQAPAARRISGCQNPRYQGYNDTTGLVFHKCIRVGWPAGAIMGG
jgi:hypothetical protein